ncbi:lef-8 [Mamestra brassicae multiple nucleopolyhedrovirus]|uniref:Lef-8 n=2 Tax=Mamestra brassicae nuclear polyhedrosis virus TaxID=78219 RepID=I3XME9_NPVMB|nr:lef-8 [Mamestra brassicae multiple nucleopolyhedrovirus]WNA17513.1 lef-8 [Alphabaculovirus mabrassicae]WRQ96705.1 lef-8 [Mamestra configurata nucleopolyhedrovirus B]AFL64982.1 lef-8 [Mamestra brassicae multiple nucleopolyhedrovirus]WRQ96866.1 lef-8 [Mamestra configurata nucleopolyhedrovirus B]WRQ97027.1 lef-8 [Mamestra configurata nucleopolyhedrovirus B]
MTDVIDDFNKLYDKLTKKYNLKFYLNCSTKNINSCTIKFLQERRSYFCCAVDPLDRCVLHKCVLIIFGTWLDKQFRADDPNTACNLNGTFMIDGRNLSFPNIMMNNNILIHNFYDKLYSKSCKRMFLYGNVDEEKNINRAIQLVYDKHENVLFARDVYASDYVVTEDLNAILSMYLKDSGKWEPINFIFDFDKQQSGKLVEQIKLIMATDINYSIDNLANKIIYKHDYLLSLIYKPILKNYCAIRANDKTIVPMRKKKLQSILFPKDCKKIIDTIVNGKLIYSVSKTFSKQKKNFINYQDNSSNNNIEINSPSLKYRIGNEVVRITNDTMRQDMLMQKYDFVQFIDSFFHGEMTVAGKKFFLCRDVRLPSVDYGLVAEKFTALQNSGLLVRNGGDDQDGELIVAFNNRPTVYTCRRDQLVYIIYELKRNRFPIELKLTDKILFINHHEGMICIKKKLLIHDMQSNTTATIAALLTPYEYHNSDSILNKVAGLQIVQDRHVSQLMSKLLQYYYVGYMDMFAITPVPKLIVSVTNLKNAMPVVEYSSLADREVFLDNLPSGNAVVVAPEIMRNDKMFYLWTIVRDNKLQTAEDPYIPDIKLPIRLYNNKINKLKGKLSYSKNETPVVKYNKSHNNNCVFVEGGNMLHMAGVVVSNVKIGWIYDGKRYKIEACRNKNFYVSKIYIYFRQIDQQKVERLDSTLTVNNNTVYLKMTMITSTSNLEGVKICGIHGQKGVMNGSEDLTQWMAEDGTCAQICLSPISYLSRQSCFKNIENKIVVRGGDFSNAQKNDNNPIRIFRIPYMFFNNTPDNIFKEFIKGNYTGHEKVEGTRLDPWTINQSMAGNRLAESLQCVRNGSNLPECSGEYNVLQSLLHCHNTVVR